MREGRRGQGRVLQVLQDEDICPVRHRPLYGACPLRVQARPQLQERRKRRPRAGADDVLCKASEVWRGTYQVSAPAHDALRAKLLPQVYSLGFLNPDVEYFV